MVWLSCDPMLIPAPPSVQEPTAGGDMSAKGSANTGCPIRGAGLMVPLPFQLPTMSVFAFPVVVIVPPPTMLIASEALEPSYTPQPVVSAVLPVIVMAPEAVGFRTITHPPELATRVPVVVRAMTIEVGKPRTDENNCGICSLTRTTTQYATVAPAEVGALPTPDWKVTFCPRRDEPI